MPSIDDDGELAALRRRAYGPGADISDDPVALRRLIELEGRVTVPEAAAGHAALDAPAVGYGARAAAAGEPAETDAPPADPIPARAAFRMPRLRRSTVVWASVALLVAASLATALVVVQRVQIDPLQAGATQVARLAPDPAFGVPPSLTRGVTGEVTAYAAFEGYRVLSYPSIRAGEAEEKCIVLWQPALFKESDSGFSYEGESLFPACGAGVFPPSYTLLLGEESPERQLTDLPAGTALQFVYDETNDEVVVFRG